MKVVQPLQDLVAPLLDYLKLGISHLLKVLPQASSGNHLGYEMDLVLLFANPSTNEGDNIGMLHLLNKSNF